MGTTQTKNPTTIITVAIAAVLIVSAVGMGVRQLLREGVFSETRPIVQKQAVEPKAPVVKKVAPELSRQDAGTGMRAEQQVKPEPVEASAEPEAVVKQAPTPRQQTSPVPDRQPAQMVNNSSNLSREEQDRLNYQYMQAIWPSLSPEDREEARRVMERWPTMSEEERDFYRGLVENLQ